MFILLDAALTWPLDKGLVGSGDFGLRESHDLQEVQLEIDGKWIFNILIFSNVVT